MFKPYYRSLPAAERRAYAERAGTTCRYIERLLRAPADPSVPNPRVELMSSLAIASRGALTFEDLFAYFYPGVSAVIDQRHRARAAAEVTRARRHLAAAEQAAGL